MSQTSGKHETASLLLDLFVTQIRQTNNDGCRAGDGVPCVAMAVIHYRLSLFFFSSAFVVVSCYTSVYPVLQIRSVSNLSIPRDPCLHKSLNDIPLKSSSRGEGLSSIQLRLFLGIYIDI